MPKTEAFPPFSPFEAWVAFEYISFVCRGSWSLSWSIWRYITIHRGGTYHSLDTSLHNNFISGNPRCLCKLFSRLDAVYFWHCRAHFTKAIRWSTRCVLYLLFSWCFSVLRMWSFKMCSIRRSILEEGTRTPIQFLQDRTLGGASYVEWKRFAHFILVTVLIFI